MDFWTIGGFVISILFGLASISTLRMHFKTGIKGLLFMGVGWLSLALGFFGITILEMNFENPVYLLFLVVLVVGLIVGHLAVVMIYTNESGLYLEFLQKTTFKQRLTGSIPIIKYEKPKPPVMSKRTGLIFGILSIAFGSLLILLHILFKIPGFTILLFIPGVFALIIGLLFVFFSIIYLDKGKKLPEE